MTTYSPGSDAQSSSVYARKLSRILAPATSLAVASTLIFSPAANASPNADAMPDLEWTDCPIAALTDPETLCAELEVPRDYSDPAGEQITVTVSRVPASSGQSQGSIAGNPGGPGGDALGMFAEGGISMPEEISQNFDLIAVQPRGLRWSTPLDCDLAGIPMSGLIAATVGGLYASCETTSPGYARTVTTENTARDLEEVRKALGEDTIGLYGTSYGSDLMSTYATLFGDKVDGMVLDSSIDADTRYFDLGTSRESWRRDGMNAMFQWMADRDDQYHLGTTPLQVYTKWSQMVNDEAGAPGQAYPPPAEVGDLPETIANNADALLPVANEILPVAWRGSSFVSSLMGSSAQTSPTFAKAMEGLYTETAWPDLASAIASGETPVQKIPEELTDQDLMDQMVSIATLERAIICNDNIVAPDPSLIGQSYAESFTGGDIFELNSLGLKSGQLCLGWPAQQSAIDHSPASLDRQPLVLHYTGDTAVTGTPAGEATRDRMNGEFLLLDGYSHVVLLDGHHPDDSDVQEAVVRQYMG